MKPQEKELVASRLDELPEVAEELIAFAKDVKNWLFIGEMGAGKTTMIKTVCELLGVVDQVSSPTFSIVNEYATAGGEVVYHFDFYRLEDVEEAVGIGVEEYFFSGNICLIEWPQLISGLLPDEFMTVHIEELLTGERKIILKHHG
jgi:tRNA threonylcarbamoyladenosine biosynthesis protein TsaE